MGEVFLAREDLPGGKPRAVAVKRLLPALERNPEVIALFLDEAALGARLQHPGIVKLLKCGEVAGRHFLAMEYVLGMSARDLMDRHQTLRTRVPARLAAEVVARVARALDHAHGLTGDDGKPLGVIHRDISPRNVLLSASGEVKLIDFGVATSRLQTHESVAGRPKGKREYMSPEQRLGRPLDARSDQFALGVLLSELAAGRHPLPTPSRPDAKGVASWLKPSEVDPALAPLDAVVGRAIAYQPDDRYPSAAALADALEAASAALPASKVTLSRLVCGMADDALDEVGRAWTGVAGRHDGSLSDMALLLDASQF